MKVLKPEMDKIQEKHKDKDPMKAQQTMALYKGQELILWVDVCQCFLRCLYFLQCSFFPASIELRQKSFLWADDLSSYDSILSLPFEFLFMETM